MKCLIRRGLCAILILAFLLTAAPVPVARAADETPKLIAFTFDDGPSAQTERLLNGLEERGAVATFFMCGKNGGYGLYWRAALVERMLAIGCEPGNHSNRHAQFPTLSAAQIRSEISTVESYLYQRAGAAYTEMVRIPYGDNSATIRANVDRPMIRWSVDTLDWKYRNANTVYNNIMDRAYDGAVVLMHDLYATSVDGALRAIDSLREQGYELVTVSELFRRRGIELENGHVYSGAPNNGVTLPAYAAPEIALAADDAAGAVRVTLSTPDEGLTLRYTTDGSTPMLTSPAYAEPFTLSADTQLRVAGFDRFATRTPVASRRVMIRTAAPQIASWENDLLTLTCPTEGAAIYYTMDGSAPSRDSTPYTEPFAPGAVTRVIARTDETLTSEPLTIVQTGSGALYRDIPADAPYLAAVDDVVERGLMSGDGSWKFSPEGYTTRASIVTTLYRLAEAHAGSDAPVFTDVPDWEWYADPVRWAAAEGVVYGMTTTTFAPADALTYEQAAAILCRFAAFFDIPSKEAEGDPDDYPGTAPYAVEAFAWCAANGIPCAALDGRFTPTTPITRAELAIRLSALCELMK